MSLLVKTNPVTTNSTPQTRRKVWGNDTALPSNQCGHCKEFGHAEIQCWKRNPKLKKVCEHCNIYGHNVSVCRYVVKPSRNRTSQQNNLAAVTNTGPRNALSGRGVGTRLLRIRNVEKISSYNWIYGNEMTILTPGQPPEWTKQHDPIQLETDGSAGLHLERLIPYPMEPAVRTLFHAKPIFRCSDVNIFGCGATLGDLFRHVQRAERHPAFRIRVDLVGDTVFFTRLSASSEEARRDAERYGRGYTISNTTSQANVSNIGSHQRIIGYNLGGLKIFLQFEADAYIEDKLPNRGDGGFTKTLSTHLDFDSTTNIYAPSPKRAPPAETLLIPHSALLRIETRANRGFDGPKVVRKQVPRLWLRQVRALALAWHFEGEFHHENVKEMDVLQSDFAGWEENNQENIRKFVSLLRALIASVRATSSGKLEAFCNEGGDIQMLEIAPDSAAILPKNLEDRWRVGASKATTAMKAQVQPMKTFSGSTVPQRNSLGNSIEEDLIDLSSETASEPRTSGQAVTAPSAYRPPINHLPPRLETTFTIDRTQSTAVAREPAVSSKSASRPAVARPAPITTASRFPISKAPISRALISKAPMSKAPMSKAPMSRAPVLRAPISTITVSTTRAANIKVANNTGLNVTAANTAVANSTAANSTPGNTLSTGSHRDSFPKDSSTLARIKDHPQYAWIATMCLFGTAFTLAICGVFVGGIIVATICAITHAGYMLCTKINSLPPVEAKCPSFESPIDSKLNPPPSAPNAQTGRVPTIPTPVTSDAKMFAGPTPDKPVEKKLVKSELIETRLPETSTVRSSPATDMPVPSKAVFVRYCKNK